MRNIKNSVIALGFMLSASSLNAAIVEFTYSGIVAESDIKGVSVGDTMTLTLLADNGGSGTLSQEWLTSDIISGRLEAGDYWQTYVDNWWWSESTVNFRTNENGELITRNFNGTDSSVNHQDSFGVGGNIYLANNLFTDYFGNNAWAGTLGGSSSWTVSEVPVPASFWLFASGILGLIKMSRSKNSWQFKAAGAG